jgi:hypothetical protein
MACDQQSALLLLQLDVVVRVEVRLGQKLTEDGAFRGGGAAPRGCDLLGQHAVELCSQTAAIGPTALAQRSPAGGWAAASVARCWCSATR